MSLLTRRRAMMSRCGRGHGLPSEYQEVTWIGSSGTQYIDPDISISDLKTEGWSADFVIQDNGQPDSNGGVIGALEYSGEWFGVNGAELKVVTTVSTVNRVQATVLWDGTGLHVYSGGTSGSQAYTRFVQPKKFILFAIPNAGWTAAYYSRIKLYSIAVKKAGTIVANLIPCYRKLDNVIGLYDAVRDRFFANSGTGTFTKGGDVT